MILTKINFKTFFIATIICGILTFVTLVAAATRDEGTGGDGVLVKILEKLFYIFRFPTHTLFFRFLNTKLFFIGLLFNCLFYGFVIERLLTFCKSRKS
ncbi:hypothetical protein D3C78_1393870 [compost metagenome]